MGRIRWKLRRIDKNDLYQVKWNVEGLRSDDIQAKYEETVSNRFGVLMERARCGRTGTGGGESFEGGCGGNTIKSPDKSEEKVDIS